MGRIARAPVVAETLFRERLDFADRPLRDRPSLHGKCYGTARVGAVQLESLKELEHALDGALNWNR